MRFRRLTKEELFALETEFKQFLIIHELYDEEWRALAENDPNKAEQFIELFSDLVLHKVFDEVSFLVHFTSHLVSFFDVRESVLKAYHFKYLGPDTIENEYDLKNILLEQFDQIELFKGEKSKEKDKADEVYALIRKGSEICTESLFQEFTRIFDSIKK